MADDDDFVELKDFNDDVAVDESSELPVATAPVSASALDVWGAEASAWKGTPRERLPKFEDVFDFTVEQPLRMTCDDDDVSVVFYPGSQYGAQYCKVRDKWENPNFVRMPHSSENVVKSGLPLKHKKAWGLIRKKLQKINSFVDVEETVFATHPGYAHKWNLNALRSFLTSGVCGADECRVLLEDTLPAMAELALRIEEICPVPIQFLKGGYRHRLVLKQEQAACLLANAFFCTFPCRYPSKSDNLPSINFSSLFDGTGRVHRKYEKLKCIFNYFRRVTQKMPKGTLSFFRNVVKDIPKWKESDKRLTELHVTSEGLIEKEGAGMLQVDFANKMVGGGVLGHGLVQEEIRFTVCPELIISRLVTPVLGPKESLIVTGCEQFSQYTGYSDSFQYAGDFTDQTPRDSWGRRMTEVVAINASVFEYRDEQFSKECVDRELLKAYSGFSGTANERLVAVATGHWGCGAFKGDKQLKALLQILAASEAKRPVCFFTFGDIEFVDELYTMYEHAKKCTVGEIYTSILQYCESQKFVHEESLYIYLQRKLVSSSTSQVVKSTGMQQEGSLFFKTAASLPDEEVRRRLSEFEALK